MANTYASAASGANTQTTSPDVKQVKDNTLYDWNDPSAAFQNALLDNGINPYAANPFVRNLQRSAAGLSDAFLQQAALKGSSMSQGQFGAPQDPTKPGEGFKEFLNKNLQGGSIYSTLRQSAANTPAAIQHVRRYQDEQARGRPATELDPWMAAYQDRLAAGNGQGTIQSLLNMTGPMMNARMLQSYGSGLGAALLGSLRNMDPMKDDIWTYLLGAG